MSLLTYYSRRCRIKATLSCENLHLILVLVWLRVLKHPVTPATPKVRAVAKASKTREKRKHPDIWQDSASGKHANAVDISKNLVQ